MEGVVDPTDRAREYSDDMECRLLRDDRLVPPLVTGRRPWDDLLLKILAPFFLFVADIAPAAPRRATVRAKCVGDLGVPRLSSESKEKRETASALSATGKWRRDRVNAERRVSLEGC